MDKDSILSGLLQELRRGVIVLVVLQSLKTPMYGYNLISQLTESGVSVEANTLYPLLRRLEGQGLLTSSWRTEGPKPRKYYETTALGDEICGVLKRQWDITAKGVEAIWIEK